MSSREAKNPNGRASTRRVIEPPDPNDRLLEQVLDRENMQRAWKRVKANRGAPGVDGMAIDDFPAFVRARCGGTKTMVVTDAHVGPHFASPAGDALRASGFDAHVRELPPGEQTKCLDPEVLDAGFGMEGGRLVAFRRSANV